MEYPIPLIEELGKLCPSPSLERVIIYCSNERDGTSAHFEYTFKVDKNGARNGDRVFGAVACPVSAFVVVLKIQTLNLFVALQVA